jgi:hypothetical protein
VQASNSKTGVWLMILLVLCASACSQGDDSTSATKRDADPPQYSIAVGDVDATGPLAVSCSASPDWTGDLRDMTVEVHYKNRSEAPIHLVRDSLATFFTIVPIDSNGRELPPTRLPPHPRSKDWPDYHLVLKPNEEVTVKHQFHGFWVEREAEGDYLVRYHYERAPGQSSYSGTVRGPKLRVRREGS